MMTTVIWTEDNETTMAVRGDNNDPKDEPDTIILKKNDKKKVLVFSIFFSVKIYFIKWSFFFCYKIRIIQSDGNWKKNKNE